MREIIIDDIAGDFYKIKQTLSEFFDHNNYIFRKNGNKVIVRSENYPDRYLKNGVVVSNKEYTPLKNGDEFPAFVRVNATRHVGNNNVPLAMNEVEEWVKNKADGFELCDIEVVDEGTLKATKNVHRITLHSYSVFAVFTVVDVEKANKTMVKGIGREKRFGFGMIDKM